MLLIGYDKKSNINNSCCCIAGAACGLSIAVFFKINITL